MRAVVVACVAVAVAVVSGADTTSGALGVAGRANEQVSVAARDRFVALAWAATSGSGTDIYSAVSLDAGESFASPVRVNSRAGEASVGGEQPPRVTLEAAVAGAAPRIVVVWTAKAASGTRLLSARSNDRGRTFSVSSIVAGSDAPGNRGWESIATDRSGRTFALWLDHRKLANAPAAMAHEHNATAPTPAASTATPPPPKADPVERAGQSQLFFGSLDGSVAPRALTGGVCYCCKTGLTTGADGSIYAVWRHVFAGNQRDIAFAMSRDHGRTFAAPVRISRDGWAIDGCPENGPAIAADERRGVHVVWPTVVSERGRETLALFYSTSRDGVSFTERLRLPTAGAAYHPQLAVEADGTVVVAWDETAERGRNVVVARSRRDNAGRVSFARVSDFDVQVGLYPTLAVTPAGTLLAWVRRADSGSTISTMRLPR